MTLGGCLTNKIAAKKINSKKGKKAKEQFEKLSKGLIDSGVTPAQAYAQAAETIAAQVKKDAAAAKHRLVARYAVQKALADHVRQAKSLRKVGTELMDRVEFDRRANLSRAWSITGEWIQKHSPNLLGKQRDPVSFSEFQKAIYGEPTTDVAAKAHAAAWYEAMEWLRMELNRYGHNIGKLENRGYQHQHNAVVIGRAGRDQWAAEIDAELDWLSMLDPRTGQTFAARPPDAFRTEYLGHVFDNITYGRDSRSASWGRAHHSGRNLERHRYLIFKNSEAWGRYNAKYGSADPFSTMLAEMDRMSTELAIARYLGAEPQTALDYAEQIAMFEARQRDVGEKAANDILGNFTTAKRMLTFLGPGLVPTGPNRFFARLGASVRQTMTAAMLDRASVIAIPSDLNSARMAAQAVEMNPTNILSTYTGLMQDSLAGGGMTRDDLLRLGHISEGHANAAVAMDRYNSEFPAAPITQNVTNAVMQLNGMTAHTGNLKIAVKESMAGHFASLKDTAWADIPEPLRRMMNERAGIEEADWNDFRMTDGLFTSQNGATLLDPLYWRKTTTLADPDRVDDVWLKMQTFVEMFTELAVPSGSLLVKGIIDPKAHGLMPGSLAYEVIKSGGMFKSFVGAFVVNQAHMVNLTNAKWGLTGTAAKTAYLAEMAGTMMLAGALAIQVNELLSGREPQNMADEQFWMRAMLRGGGLGPLGDLLTVGTTSWGGGAEGYIAGPAVGLAGDVLQLFGVNAVDAISDLSKGEPVDTGFGRELRDTILRLTPGAQLPILGPLADRIVGDQVLLALDPRAIEAMAEKAQRRENLYGNGEWWPTGSPLPTRAPDMGNAWSP